MLLPNRAIVLALLLQLIVPTWAKRSLSASYLVTCMDNSQISPSYFNVTFNPDDRSLRYSLDLTTEISTYIVAHIQVYAYGFIIIERDVDMCSLGWKQFCPIYPGSMQVESVEYLGEGIVNQIPEIAYNVPDIDAVVKVIVRDRSTGRALSCLQSSFTNGKTVAQTGVKWATAVIAGLGLLIAAVLSTFGNSNAASHISANAVSLFLYFQSVVVVCMQHVERVPPIASAWAENLAWSMGLIRVQFMQDIFRWYIQSTGGTPTLYFKGTTKQILVQRALNYLRNIHDFAFNDNRIVNLGKRSLDFSLNSNVNLIVLRGIKKIGYNSGIEPTSIVVTGYTFFILCGFLLTIVIVLIKRVLELLVRFNKIKSNKLSHFRTSFSNILKGSLLRYIYIGFTQLVILSLWEFTVVDSPAVVVLAVLFLILTLGLIGFSYWKTINFGKRSINKFNNPAALLYGESKILNKYGFCYTMFHAEKYWFGSVLVCYNLVKSIFIGLCQGSGKTSVLVLFILDLAYTIYLIIQAPYLNKATNIVNYLMSVVNTVNSFLFLFFSDLFGQPAQVSSIMGWVFFVLNAAFSLILLLLIIVLITLSIVSKNPDARFAPAKDDRTSFQRKSSIKHQSARYADKTTNELSALGLAAQDHTDNWESEMYKLTGLSQASKSSESDQIRDILTPNLEDTEKFADDSELNHSIEDAPASISAKQESENQTLGSKLKNKLTRGLSMKSYTKNKEISSPNYHADNQNKIQTVSDSTNHNDGYIDENEDVVNSTLPRNDSRDPINSHNRHDSYISTGSISNYSDGMPTSTRDFI